MNDCCTSHTWTLDSFEQTMEGIYFVTSLVKNSTFCVTNYTLAHLSDVANFLYLDVIFEYIDTYYIQFLWWLWYPTLVSIMLPITIAFLLYFTSFFFYLFKTRHRLTDASYDGPMWAYARRVVAWAWLAHGRVWNGYEVHGIENIPKTGPALLIFYHGTIPLDMYYLLAESITTIDRRFFFIGDKFLFKIPGWQLLLRVFGVTPGTVKSCSGVLQQGGILVIAPGGVREALFGGTYYNVLWGQRRGFAKVVKETKVPVIPVFTENLREATRALGCGSGFFMRLYEKTRLPLVPMIGHFPVKLRTFIGQPLVFSPEDSVEEIARQTQSAVEALVQRHQRLPGNILKALLDRLPFARPFL